MNREIFKSGHIANTWLKSNYTEIFKSIWGNEFKNYLEKYRKDKRLFSFWDKIDATDKALLLEEFLINQDEFTEDTLRKCLEITKFVCYDMKNDVVQHLLDNVYEINIACYSFDLSGFLNSLDDEQQCIVCDTFTYGFFI